MKNIRKTLGILMVVGLLLPLSFSSAFAAIPETINYQGYLTDNSGNPVTTSVSITFKLYTVASGGTHLWTETHNVTPDDGVYSVVLGLTNNLFLDYTSISQYYLGVQVGADGEMTPRQLITSVGSSHTADTALDLVCTNCVAASDVNLAEIQKRVTGTCATGNSIREIKSDGTVTCEPADGIAAETDPQVGAVTLFKWCVGDGSAVQCSVNQPVLSETDPKVGVLTSGKWCTTNGTSVICTADLPSETDPQVGSLTNGKWCTTNGTQVSCTADAPTTLSGWTDDGTVVRLTTNTDKVGIGTATLTEELHVKDTVGQIYLQGVFQGTSSSGGIALLASNGQQYELQALNNGNFTLYDRNDEKHVIYIDTNQNIGVGTTVPSEKLQVEGNLLVKSTAAGKSLRLRTTGAALDFDISGHNLWMNGDGGNIMLVHNARKNVGIGTTDPKSGYKLDIGGNMHVSGTINKEYAGTTHRVIPAAYGDISPTTEHKLTNNFTVTRNCNENRYEIHIDGETNFCDRYAVSITFKDYGAIRIARTSTVGCEYVLINIYDIWGNKQTLCGDFKDNHAFTFVVFIQ
jgi:hypothetical protein